MRTFRRVALCAALVALSGCQQSDSPPPTENAASLSPDSRPNILFILADDLGFTDVGFFGGEIPTPNLDQLALGGLRFTNFHVCTILSADSRYVDVGHDEPGGRRHPAQRSAAHGSRDIAGTASATGYHTYMAGKWNLGIKADEAPDVRGFDASFALMPPGDNHLGHSNFPDDVVAYRENGAPATLPDNWFSSELYTNKLIEYIEANADDGAPWFGYLALTAPHWPLQVPNDWIDRHAGHYDDGYDALRAARMRKAKELGIYPEALSTDGYAGRAPLWADLDDDERAEYSRAMEIYAAMTENMDMHIGRLVEYLRESGEFGNTVIVFASDNGPDGNDSSFVPTSIPRTDTDNSLANMGRAGSFTLYGRGWSEAATAPYRDVKGSLHSGGTLAASFVYHPSVRKQRWAQRYLRDNHGLLPTFLEIAAEPTPSGDFQGREVLPVRGESFWGLVSGAVTPFATKAMPFRG